MVKNANPTPSFCEQCGQALHESPEHHSVESHSPSGEFLSIKLPDGVTRSMLLAEYQEMLLHVPGTGEMLPTSQL